MTFPLTSKTASSTTVLVLGNGKARPSSPHFWRHLPNFAIVSPILQSSSQFCRLLPNFEIFSPILPSSWITPTRLCYIVEVQFKIIFNRCLFFTRYDYPGPQVRVNGVSEYVKTQYFYVLNWINKKRIIFRLFANYHKKLTLKSFENMRNELHLISILTFTVQRIHADSMSFRTDQSTISSTISPTV